MSDQERDDALRAQCEDLYVIHRRYIEHEDTLVNNRTTWLITVQSFLIATFGFTFEAKYELVSHQILPELGNVAVRTPEELQTFQTSLAVVGLFTGFVALLSLRAAARAITSVRRSWEKHPLAKPCRDYLPPLMGGGDPGARRAGISFPILLPIFFMLFWAATADFVLNGAQQFNWVPMVQATGEQIITYITQLSWTLVAR